MKLNKRAVVLLVSLVVLLTVVVGVTVAFIIDGTNGITNTFTPSRVACQVVDKTGNTYTVKNIGDTDAYIRATVLVNWKNAAGNVYALTPEFGVTPGDDWVLGSDGYYYYTKSVAPNGTVIDSVLTVSVTPGDPPSSEYTLTVEVVASAVQATADAVDDWSNSVATVNTDGNLTVKTGP